MNALLTAIRHRVNSRLGFFGLVVILFWLKTLLAYTLDFSLGVSGIYQYFILIINPLATTLIFFGIALYIKKPWWSYLTLLVLHAANTALLYFNVIYYREFTDFMTINTITGFSKVSNGISGSSLALTKGHDVFYWLDIVVLLVLLLARLIKVDKKLLPRRLPWALTSLGVVLFAFNLTLGEIDRPQLLTRTFDRNYIVKYLGIDAYTINDAFKTARNDQVRASASTSDLASVQQYIKQHYAAADPQMFGLAKGRNVIVIHLESFEQFLIDDKIDGKEVTPFLNSLYHDKQTYAFANFFHQVGQGKTSDAENLLETSTYGLPEGSLFSQLGSDNTFQAAPAILQQTQGYSSAVFHGDVASFWNRNNVYKNMGYQNFFDKSYFDAAGDRSIGYGLKDKLLFKDSVKYLEQMQQPFYAKFITVTNHFPFEMDSEDTDFPKADTADSSVNNYFQSAHYLDQSVEEFFAYLKASGLYDKSIIVLYGDHYGISNTRNLDLAPLLGKSADDWTAYDDAQMQRVPFMIHIPGVKTGSVQQQYAGEVDVLPTIEHLLGIKTKRYLQFGTDVFSSQHDQVVAFRDGDWVSPQYTKAAGNVYDQKTGTELTKLTKTQQTQVDDNQNRVTTALRLSDKLNNGNLLRFYTPKGFKPVQPQNYNYTDGFTKLAQLRENLGQKSTSLYSQNHDHSTADLYQTDAPEAK